MNKKRFFFILSLLFVLIFLDGFSTSCKAYTTYNGAPQLTVSEMEQIISKISMDNIFSGDVVSTVTSTFNTWARTRIATQEFYLNNIIFFRYNSTSQRWICWALGNGTYSDTLPYLYVAPSSLSNYLTTTSNNIFIRNFSDWVYDANNNKTSASVGNTTFYYIDIGNPSNYFTSTSGATVITNDKNGTRQNITISSTSGGVPTLYIPNLITFAQPYTVTSYTQDYGRDYYFLTNSLTLENESMFPTPTPTPSIEPTAEPTGGGGGSSVDLTETNNKIDDVNVNLENIKEEIPKSGEIATIIKENNEDFWGNSGDLDGEVQEDDISDSIDNLVQSASGELAQNEIFGALSDFEQGFFNLFVERDPLLLDLKVSWPNIYSLADGNEEFLIESGEINFSEMCRNNETLGNIQDVVRVIFNFYFGVSLLVYLYNLVLSTLGIDNPFLYDNPENGYEDIVYDINTGTETSYVHKTYPNSFRRHQTLIWRRK